MKAGCIGVSLFLALLLCTPPLAAEDGKDDFTGSVEVIYRNVSVDGSDGKYDEDFDGLGSGVRLGNFSANWLNVDSGVLDYARVEASGLGGDPFERTWFEFGRKDAYELSVNHTRQAYIYDLFELVTDEDASTWDAERRRTDIDLKVHATDNVDLVFRYEEGLREGTSLFMKDIERDVFRLETPLDQTMRRYTVGADLKVGVVDIVLRQTLRRYDNQFNNTTEGNLGLDLGDTTELDHYAWIQNDSGGSDWTTVRLSAPIGERVDVTVGLFGTFFGDEEINTRVRVDAEGTDFNGDPFTIVDGFGITDVEGDTVLVDADLTVKAAEQVNVHLQYRSLDRDVNGTSLRDLDGNGTTDSVETRNDYQIDTSTVLVEYRPVREVGLRAGYRRIDRELVRNGFIGIRNLDFESKDDDTVILGLSARPVRWFRLNADHENGDISQPFNAVAPRERDRTRVRATFLPQKEMRFDLSYLDYENRNVGIDIRAIEVETCDGMDNDGDDLIDEGCWNGSLEGNTWAASFWHAASDRVDYYFRYARQEVDTDVRILFDQDSSGVVETGRSVFDNDNTQWTGQINCRWQKRWRGYVRYYLAESDGDDRVLGDEGFGNDEMIDQEYKDAEIGLVYTFDSGLFVGGSLRDFDYDDLNSSLDYDGQVFTVRLGTTF